MTFSLLIILTFSTLLTYLVVVRLFSPKSLRLCLTIAFFGRT